MKELEGLSKLKQRDPLLRFRFDPELSVIRDLRGKLAEVSAKGGVGLRAAGLRFLKTYRGLFGDVAKGKMTVLDESTDPQGGKSLTLQQYHGPYRVYGGSVRLHTTKEGTLDNINNRLFPDLAQVAKRPRVSEQQAIKSAQKGTKCQSPPAQKPEVLVYRHKGKARLVWEIRLNDTRIGERGVPAQWICYVDAVNGKVLVCYDNIQTAGSVVGTGTGYYSGGGAVNAWFNDTTYQLRDTSRTPGGPEIITNDEDGASPSEDPDDNWNDGTTSPRDQNQGAEVDAHRYAGAVADYYSTVHGRNSFDGAGGTFRIISHLGTNYSNGYWDGAKVNLGDGTGVAATGDDYECSDDWLAHEFTHGYTQFTCALQYLNESGALNEAFSDIFAAFITGDWLIFEDTWLKASAPAWRNMIDPTNGGLWNPADPITSVLAGHQPSHYSVRYTGASDNGGVHINSGIINNLFYLLTVGGTHTVSGITVTGIGQAAAEQMLFRCQSVNLVGHPTATFLDFRVAMLDACLDLFPTDLVKLSQVKNAFNAVGIGPDIYVRDNLADTGAEPYPGTYLYASPDVINRTSASANPALDFADLTNDALWQNVEFGQNNFVYIRLQNRGVANGDATINVYFSSATTFGTPASWIHIGTLTETTITPGSLRIAGPLTFPSALIPSPGHYCMIAVVSDALDPAPDHTLITSVSDYVYFVRNTNNMAYRNMDVVNVVPGLPGVLKAMVQTMPGVREQFDLRVDAGRVPPGTRVRLRGPAQILNGAIPRGLKLVARKGEQNVYEVLMGAERARHLAFQGVREPAADYGIGFEKVLVEKAFPVVVEYLLPDMEALRAGARYAPRDGYVLAIRQLWKGETVGAVALRFVARQKEEPPKRKPAKRKPAKRKAVKRKPAKRR